MIRFDIAVLALTLGVTAVACGGSDTPPKDPSSDPAATMPANPDATPTPPPADAPDPAGSTPAAPASGTATH